MEPEVVEKCECGGPLRRGFRCKGLCKTCYNRNYQSKYAKTPRGIERSRVNSKKWGAKIRAIRKVVVETLGNRCTCCGETESMFLTVDHINGGGTAHRLKRSNLIWRDIQREGFPRNKYRVLCYNCNCGREQNGGTCPHEEHKFVVE